MNTPRQNETPHDTGEKSCLPERATKLMIASILLVFSLGMIVVGFTILPVIGFLFAVPGLFFSVYFFRAHLNERCQIENRG